MSRKFFIIFVFLTLVGLRSVSVFGLNIEPSQISPTIEKFRLIFVTSTTINGTSSNQKVYDDFVTDHTDGATDTGSGGSDSTNVDNTLTFNNLGQTWQAIVSVGNDGGSKLTTNVESVSYDPTTPLNTGEYINAADHISANQFTDTATDAVILLVDDNGGLLSVVANNYTDFWNAGVTNLVTKIQNSETGSSSIYNPDDGGTPSKVWTGSSSGGTAVIQGTIGVDNIDAYMGSTIGSTLVGGTVFSANGRTDANDIEWVTLSAPPVTANSSALPLYGISGVITNPNYSAAVPEPSTYLMLGSTLLFAGYARNHRRKKIAVIRN